MVNPIPKQIEVIFDTIQGKLTCIDCKKVVIDWGMETNDPRNLPYREYTIPTHFCPLVKFNFDFDSPLSVEDQYKTAKMKYEKEKQGLQKAQ